MNWMKRFSRPNLALALFLLYLLGTALLYTRQVQDVHDPQQVARDSITLWDQQMQRLRQEFPNGGQAGYVADWDIPGAEYNLPDQETEYILTQYALVPVVVRRGLNDERVIANLSDRQYLENPMFADFKLAGEFYAGMYLLERKSK